MWVAFVVSRRFSLLFSPWFDSLRRLLFRYGSPAPFSARLKPQTVETTKIWNLLRWLGRCCELFSSLLCTDCTMMARWKSRNYMRNACNLDSRKKNSKSIKKAKRSESIVDCCSFFTSPLTLLRSFVRSLARRLSRILFAQFASIFCARLENHRRFPLKQHTKHKISNWKRMDRLDSTLNEREILKYNQWVFVSQLELARRICRSFVASSSTNNLDILLLISSPHRTSY